MTKSISGMCSGKKIDEILAKSDGTTLYVHIQDDLKIYKRLRQLFPKILEITAMFDFWDLLFCAIFFHDFGKIHNEFQKKLKGKANYWDNQRHEIYSVPFIDKLNLEQDKINLIKRAVLGHHKSFEELRKMIINDKDLKFEYETKWKDKLKYHPKDFINSLRCNFRKEILNEYFKLFGILEKEFDVSISLSNRKIKVDNLKNPIEKYTNFNCEYLSKEYFQNLMLWAGLKIADHLGSAKIEEIYKLEKEHFSFIDYFKMNFNLHKHQKESFNCKTSTILIAPTGSGKTESALGWLKNVLEKNQGRVFYILPYTASINAMHKRLTKLIEGKNEKLSNIVGILHGNLSHYISEYFIQGFSKDENIKRNKKIKKLIEQYRTMISPLLVATPFQLLKYFFGIKGFEKGLFFLSGAKLIFDEIHAYDVKTFAQIVVMLKFLKKYLLCDIFIMTATLPSFMREILQKKVGFEGLIYAEESLLKNLKRHKIILKDGDIFKFLDNEILNFEENKEYIIVCNTVSRAQEVYKKILENEKITESEIVLLHSRFNQNDRNKKEIVLMEEKVKVLIGTQTIEVSLDIDFDIMITEPAPLDALIQRFGRVNRKAKKEIAPIYICTEGGEYDNYIYPVEKIMRTLSVLKEINELNELDIQSMLDKVYPNWDNKEQEEFNSTFALFNNSLESLMPYSFSKSEEDFYSRFTDVKVLPIRFYDKYIELTEKCAFIEAEKLLVNINRNLFCRYLKDKLIEKKEIIIEINENLIKNDVYVVRLKYDENIGLTNEKEDINFKPTFL